MRNLALLLSILTFISGAPRALAQLEVSISLGRDNYVSLENIEATVTVKNTVGKDVVLGGKGGASWLNFQIHNSNGVHVTAIRAPILEPLMIRNGQSLKKKFSLDRHYYLSDSGSYIVRAAAWFPDLEKHLVSQPKRFTVQSPRTPKWQEVFAVPDAGGYRRFQVSTFDDTNKSLVCLSVLDEETKMVMSRSALGPVILEKDIQPALDNRKHLHLVYLSTPGLYVYQQMDPTGRIIDLKYFQAEKSAPKLVKNPDGSVDIAGGTPFDPNAPPKDDGIRKLSDRPR